MMAAEVASRAATETAIHLYAEHLLNIRALTLTATLSTHSSALTRAVLSADGSSLTLSHENVSATIVLPTTLAGGGDAVLELPQERAKELRLRLRLEEKQKGFLEAPFRVLDEGNWVPWGAHELEGRHGTIQCAKCGEALIVMGRRGEKYEEKSQGVDQWKDLPNENWAEMMDFWHCHKPTPHEETSKEIGGAKGYAAGNKLRAVKYVGYVDLESFLFVQGGCYGIKAIETPNDPTSEFLCCKSCKAVVGAVDESADGWRVWKRSLKLTFEPRTTNRAEQEAIEQHFPAQKWIAARFLALIENQGVRKFEVRDANADAGAPRLFIWIFTPDLTFSSSFYPPSLESPNYNRPTRAIRALWKHVEPEATATNDIKKNNRSSSSSSPSKPAAAALPFQGETLNTSFEEVAFPSEAFAELEEVLTSSQNFLPETAREFQEWKVGLLQRFDKEDMKGKLRVIGGKEKPIDVRGPLLE